MSARRRGLLFGCGRMGSHHARQLRARPEVDLTVVDPALGLAVPPLRPGAWDFAVVATPSSTHAAVAGPLLDLGVPVLVEKPVTGSVDGATALAARGPLVVSMVERFNPVWDALRTLDAAPGFVAAERLGPPAAGPPVDGDVLADLLVHDLDLLLRLCAGAPVSVRDATGVGLQPDGPLDIAEARLRAGPLAANLGVSRVSARRVRTWRVVAPGAYLSLDLLAGQAHRVDWGRGDLRAVPVPLGAGDALHRLHSAFFAFIDGRGPSPCPPAEAIAALALADAVRAAISGPAAS